MDAMSTIANNVPVNSGDALNTVSMVNNAINFNPGNITDHINQQNLSAECPVPNTNTTIPTVPSIPVVTNPIVPPPVVSQTPQYVPSTAVSTSDSKTTVTAVGVNSNALGVANSNTGSNAQALYNSTANSASNSLTNAGATAINNSSTVSIADSNTNSNSQAINNSNSNSAGNNYVNSQGYAVNSGNVYSNAEGIVNSNATAQNGLNSTSVGNARANSVVTANGAGSGTIPTDNTNNNGNNGNSNGNGGNNNNNGNGNIPIPPYNPSCGNNATFVNISIPISKIAGIVKNITNPNIQFPKINYPNITLPTFNNTCSFDFNKQNKVNSDFNFDIRGPYSEKYYYILYNETHEILIKHKIKNNKHESQGVKRFLNKPCSVNTVEGTEDIYDQCRNVCREKRIDFAEQTKSSYSQFLFRCKCEGDFSHWHFFGRRGVERCPEDELKQCATYMREKEAIIQSLESLDSEEARVILEKLYSAAIQNYNYTGPTNRTIRCNTTGGGIDESQFVIPRLDVLENRAEAEQLRKINEFLNEQTDMGKIEDNQNKELVSQAKAAGEECLPLPNITNTQPQPTIQTVTPIKVAVAHRQTSDSAAVPDNDSYRIGRRNPRKDKKSNYVKVPKHYHHDDTPMVTAELIPKRDILSAYSGKTSTSDGIVGNLSPEAYCKRTSGKTLGKGKRSDPQGAPTHKELSLAKKRELELKRKEDLEDEILKKSVMEDVRDFKIMI